MALTLTTPNTLLGVLQPKTEAAKTWTNIATVLLGTVLLTLSAKINVPVQPVPVTLQTFAVALIAASLGWRMAVATVALYLVEGLAGLPVFANGGGPLYVLSPTFGFIVGFLPMAYIIGRVADRGDSAKPVPLFGAMVIGDAVCFLLGYLWLVAMSGGAAWIDQSDVWWSALGKAVQPFVLWDILKLAFATATVIGAWTLFRRKA
jgi:biotin transport system substrate-specific component